MKKWESNSYISLLPLSGAQPRKDWGLEPRDLLEVYTYAHTYPTPLALDFSQN